MTMRNITSHHSNDCNRNIEVFVHADSNGGAPVRYFVFGPRQKIANGDSVPSFGFVVKFQDGPIADGINGITNEVLLAIVEDRLNAFQHGCFACSDGEAALSHIRAARNSLFNRTLQRRERGVEGTHQP